jgi:hypothetical protein
LYGLTEEIKGDKRKWKRMGDIKKLQCEERRHGLHHMKDQQKKSIAPNPRHPQLNLQFPLQPPITPQPRYFNTKQG